MNILSSNLDGAGLGLGSDSLSANRDLEVLLAKVHLCREGGGGLPHARGSGRALLEHLVDLLECETLGLGDQEESEDEGDAAETAPHEENVRAKTGRVVAVGNKVWGNYTNYAVPEPVGC